MPYIIELEPFVWLAPWSGDPGRTLNLEYAEVFTSIQKAKKALIWAREYRPFKQANIQILAQSPRQSPDSP